MSITETYFKFVRDSRWYADAGTENSLELNYLILGVAGEAGETADAWKKLTREYGLDPETGGWASASEDAIHELIAEVGDVTWYIQGICVMLGISIEELMILNMSKLIHKLRTKGKEDKIPFEVEEQEFYHGWANDIKVRIVRKHKEVHGHE